MEASTSRVMSARSVANDAPTLREAVTGWLDMAVGSFEWQVHETYTVANGLIRSEGPVVERYVPLNWREVSDELRNLADASDEKILAWVQRHGFVGIVAAKQAGRLGRVAPSHESVESFAEIRRACREFAQARKELRRLHAVSRIARRATMEILAQQLARAVNLYARPDVRLVRTAHGRLGLQAGLLAIGPLGAAYVQLLGMASAIEKKDAEDPAPVHWRAIRACALCGIDFRPRRREQMWCSARCRKAASRAERESPAGSGLALA